uniref:O-methyltransferase n=1 Tax=Iris hollandica TaxID=35876 RepID=A0A8W9_IRIHO|nr:O-methyltransferase [Iris x hollandica]
MPGLNAAAKREESGELLQAHATVMHEVLAHAGSMALKCAVELDIPGIISSHGGSITLSDLVSHLDVPRSSSSSIRRIMRPLVLKGYFIHDKKLDSYRLTPLSSVLVHDSPTSLATFVMGMLDINIAAPWHSLSTFCRMGHHKGSSVYELEFGRSVWELGQEDPEFSRLFNETMDGDSRSTMKALVAECAESFEGLRTLVDVGGGDGTATRVIAEAFPHVKCTVYDLPHVVAEAKPKGSLVQAVGGSMFDHIPRADAVFMKVVLHDWVDEDCVKILKLCKEAIPSREEGGKVMIVDIVMDAAGAGAGAGQREVGDEMKTETQLFFDLTMMVYMGGKEREEDEWKKIFRDAGFTDYKITPLGLRSLIELFP